MPPKRHRTSAPDPQAGYKAGQFTTPGYAAEHPDTTQKESLGQLEVTDTVITNVKVKQNNQITFNVALFVKRK